MAHYESHYSDEYLENRYPSMDKTILKKRTRAAGIKAAKYIDDRDDLIDILEMIGLIPYRSRPAGIYICESCGYFLAKKKKLCGECSKKQKMEAKQHERNV